MIQKIFLNNLDGKHKGSVLLLALLVMSTIMAASTGLAVIVISEIRQSRSIDNAILAYYGAESGVEESLYKIRKEKESIENLVKEEELSNGVNWWIGADDISNMVEKISVAELKKEQFIELDIYDPTAGEPTNIRYLGISVGEGSGNVEVSWFGWQGGNLSEYKVIPSVLLEENERQIIDLTSGVGPQFAYRVKIKSLNNDIQLLEVKAYSINPIEDEDAESELMPARIRSTVRGEYRGSRQAIYFEMPRQSPLGGLFDFVLFSEESIIKGLME